MNRTKRIVTLATLAMWAYGCYNVGQIARYQRKISHTPQYECAAMLETHESSINQAQFNVPLPENTNRTLLELANTVSKCRSLQLTELGRQKLLPLGYRLGTLIDAHASKQYTNLDMGLEKAQLLTDLSTAVKENRGIQYELDMKITDEYKTMAATSIGVGSILGLMLLYWGLEKNRQSF